MKSLEDLIEEAKLRTVWWILCIFAVCYFMTHTSKSMLMNFPIAILFVFGLRFLFNEVDFRWKVRSHHPKSYLSHLEKKQLSVNDYRLTSQPAPQRWRRKIDSPIVEAAIEDFVNKIVHDFVTDLWYSEITPDKEAPELMHSMVMDALGEVCGRVKEINLVELLTKNVVDLVGDHLDLFRMNQAAIGVDVMATLSFEEKDDRLKHHLLESKELHPALISPESEYKVLQRITGGILAVVLRTRDAQSPLVRCIARELLTCLVIQPLLNFASPVYINELIECIISYNIDGSKDAITEQLIHTQIHSGDLAVSDEQDQVIGNLRKYMPSSNYVKFMSQSSGQSVLRDNFGSDSLNSIWDETSDIVNPVRGEPVQARHAEWAKEFEAVTQRRSEVLTPENLENMWAIGRNYKKKLQQAGVGEKAAGLTSSSSLSSQLDGKYFSGEVPNHKPESSTRNEEKNYVEFPPRPQLLNTYSDLPVDALHRLEEVKEMIFEKESSAFDDVNSTSIAALEKRNKHKRSSSTSDVKIFSKVVDDIEGKSRVPIINEYYSADFQKINVHNVMSRSDMVLSHERLNAQKFKCRVVGAYFEKIGSNSFAVYSISVTDSGKKTWSVKRRYRNFERLHRQLKNIPNYTLHLPPKRIFSSSTEDAFVHQRCIQLDKYLQDLLSIANVAEQHEVWDFFSATSKNYSFGNSASVMKTLAVNVDDAKDDIFRQFKGVSDSLTWKGSGSSSSLEQDATAAQRHLSWNADEPSKSTVIQTVNNSMINYSDNDEVDKDADNGEANFEAVTPAVEMISNQVNFSKRGVAIDDLNFKEIHSSRLRSEPSSLNSRLEALPPLSSSVVKEDPSSAPLEWSPPNLSVPILNLVDKVFQLNRRGWIRRQVYWISKQILQLIMEDAIDDWLSSQIQWLRREDVIAQGIHWVKDVLWPNGTFFLKLRPRGPLGDSEAAVGAEEITKLPGETRGAQPGTFEQQLEAARRASYVKNMIFNGAPSPLVGLIGQNQYRRSARDIYYFLQSTICLKQLSYGILEIFVISIFPELRDLITDIHKMNV